MATSGSYNYTESVSATTLIDMALRRIGVLGSGVTNSSTEEADAIEALNFIVKEWTNQGADIWTRKTGILFLKSAGEVRSYTVGTSGTASFATDYAMTTLSADAAASATTITVTDDTNIADTNIILVEEDDGTFTVDVVSGAPSSNSVTLTTGMGTAASSGNYVYTWTATTSEITHKIVDILHVTRKLQDDTDDDTNTTTMPGLESNVRIIGESEYRSLSDKLETGAPTQLFHRTGPVTSELFVWPTGGDGYDKLIIEYVAHMEDIDAAANNFDLLPGGFNALTFQLAYELSFEYGLPDPEKRRLKSEAEQKKEDFFNSTIEDASVVFALGGHSR